MVLRDDDWADDIADLYIMEEPEDALRMLSSFVRPMSPEQRAEREQMYREPGCLTRETIARLLTGEFR